MSLIGTALGIIANVITDAVNTSKTKKRVDKLNLSLEELDKEYEVDQKYDFINTEPAKRIVEGIDKNKTILEASGGGLFNPQASSAEGQVAKAAKYNIEYNDAIKEIVAAGKKQREREEDEHLRNRQLIENKISNTENSKNGSSGFKVNVDFVKKSNIV